MILKLPFKNIKMRSFLEKSFEKPSEKKCGKHGVTLYRFWSRYLKFCWLYKYRNHLVHSYWYMSQGSHRGLVALSLHKAWVRSQFLVNITNNFLIVFANNGKSLRGFQSWTSFSKSSSNFCNYLIVWKRQGAHYKYEEIVGQSCSKGPSIT